jgi:hypothetical protein
VEGDSLLIDAAAIESRAGLFKPKAGD